MKAIKKTFQKLSFHRFSTTGNVAGAVNWLRYNGGDVNTEDVLRTLYQDYFDGTPRNSGYKSRPNALKLVILFRAGNAFAYTMQNGLSFTPNEA